jgi:hypothetical protein
MLGTPFMGLSRYALYGPAIACDDRIDIQNNTLPSLLGWLDWLKCRKRPTYVLNDFRCRACWRVTFSWLLGFVTFSWLLSFVSGLFWRFLAISAFYGLCQRTCGNRVEPVEVDDCQSLQRLDLFTLRVCSYLRWSTIGLRFASYQDLRSVSPIQWSRIVGAGWESSNCVEELWHHILNSSGNALLSLKTVYLHQWNIQQEHSKYNPLTDQALVCVAM